VLAGRGLVGAWSGRVGSRWGTLGRDARIALVGISVLVVAAVGVRVWLMVGYAPAFLGFPDSTQYLLAAENAIFRSAQHPAGYPLFLRLVHYLSSSLPFTIAVQHLGGIATGVLLYAAVRRTEVSAWLALAPAAIVFFGGTGLILEHSLMSDSLFALLQAAGVYFAIRALYDPALRWALLAGVAIGLSFWVRTVALSSAVLVPLVLLCAAPGALRRRALSAAAVALAVLALIAAYAGAQDYFTGFLGYERQGSWNLYGRVATFVDCAHLAAPPGTRFLCPSEPLGHRVTENAFQYASSSPAVERFGFPDSAPRSADAVLLKFSEAAIEQQPIAYAGAIVRGLGFYLFPRAGEGYTPEEVRSEVISTAARASFERRLYSRFYPHITGYTGSASSIHPLVVYERYTLVQGPLLVALLAIALCGALFPRGRTRWASILFTFTALLSITFAIAGDSYDARFAYPTFGPLVAGAALGAWGAGAFLARHARRLHRARAIAGSEA
jgi:hypothetical protein